MRTSAMVQRTDRAQQARMMAAAFAVCLTLQVALMAIPQVSLPFFAPKGVITLQPGESLVLGKDGEWVGPQVETKVTTGGSIDPQPDQNTRLKPFFAYADLHTNPTRLEFPVVGLDVPVMAVGVKDGMYETAKGVANWRDGGTRAGEAKNLVFWAYDKGWKQPKDMPFAKIRNSLVKPGDNLYVYDEHNLPFGYVYEGSIVVASDKVDEMLPGFAGKVTLILSAGWDIRDKSGKLVDTTHHLLYLFRRMTASEMATQGAL